MTRFTPAWIGCVALLAASCGNAVPSPSHAPAPASASGPGPSTAPAALAPITIKVTDLRNHRGQLIFGIFRSPDGFPNDSTKAVVWQVKNADADTVSFTASLPPGRYGASVLHDE